ncbi:uncharacterized protein FA14DRAFT_160722 [Meira miltonrushii]|uniref:Uncharacterized protein n=1 Tax=Meira miltonrushii TaxID=1280837 RepID=A0A316VDB9_9BASI|nr:uncharacterized protein FA14DRAFT_160722 [Meira miltonrushii]PWN35677.1 hypothetical protein FA14DRAFT_160722 [Meira miltonrushii]
MAPLNAMLLELPLLLAAFGFSIAMMGLGGAHIHQWASLQDKIANQSSLPGFVGVDNNNITNVDYAIMILGAIQFVFSIFAMLMSCEQLKKRRGEYSGKGTKAWLVVGLTSLLLLGAWTGVVSAYTAFSTIKFYKFTQGPNYSEPFNTEQQLYLRQINYFIQAQITSSLKLVNIPGFPLGEWSNIYTIQEANAYLNTFNYNSIFSYRAAVAVGWFQLGSVFLVTVVHFALPFAWRYLNLLREPKKDPSSRYNDLM